MNLCIHTEKIFHLLSLLLVDADAGLGESIMDNLNVARQQVYRLRTYLIYTQLLIGL